MIGMPNETKDDILMTKKLIDRIDPDYFAVTILCPYPGSGFYSEKFKSVKWEDTDEYYNDFWNTKYLSNKELKYWQKYLMNDRRVIQKGRIGG